MFVRAVLQAANLLTQLAQARAHTGAHVAQGMKEYSTNIQKIKNKEDICSQNLQDELVDGVWRQVRMHPPTSRAATRLQADRDQVIARLEEPLEEDPTGIQWGTELTDHGVVNRLPKADVAEWGNAVLRDVVAEWRGILRVHLKEVNEDTLMEEWQVLKGRYITEFCNRTYSEMWTRLDAESRTDLIVVMTLLRTLA